MVIRLYIIFWDFLKLNILLLRIIHLVTYFDFCMIVPIVNRSQYIWNIFEYNNWSKRFSVHLKVQSKNILFLPPVLPASPPPCLTPPPSDPWAGSSCQWALVRTLPFPPDSSWMWLLVTMQSLVSHRCCPPRDILPSLSLGSEGPRRALRVGGEGVLESLQ